MEKRQPETTTAVVPGRPSRAEHVSDAIVHGFAIVAAIAAVPVLITLGVMLRGDWVSVAALAIYGACLIAMLVFSAIYNLLGDGPRQYLWRRLDHSAIYLKIAGAFTPLVALTGGTGTGFLAAIWGAAIGGCSIKFFAIDRLKWAGLALYLGMGWLGVVFAGDLLTAISPTALRLVVAAGILYTVGVVFFLWEALPFHTPIWHGFVVAASALVYGGVLAEVIRTI